VRLEHGPRSFAWRLEHRAAVDTLERCGPFVSFLSVALCTIFYRMQTYPRALRPIRLYSLHGAWHSACIPMSHESTEHTANGNVQPRYREPNACSHMGRSVLRCWWLARGSVSCNRRVSMAGAGANSQAPALN